MVVQSKVLWLHSLCFSGCTIYGYVVVQSKVLWLYSLWFSGCTVCGLVVVQSKVMWLYSLRFSGWLVYRIYPNFRYCYIIICADQAK